MNSNQDGTGVPPYAAETAREISELGPGGHGNFESLKDARERGVTPGLVATTKARADEESLQVSEEATGSDITERIREKAYELWLLEGRPDGRDLQHWQMATELVRQKQR